MRMRVRMRMRMRMSERSFVDLTDVTLTNKDTNSILPDIRPMDVEADWLGAVKQS